MKSIIIGILLACSIGFTKAQQTLIYTHADLLFEQGKELYNQRKYAASLRNFDEFLSNSDKIQAGQRHEAEFYQIANAYELRQENVVALITQFLNKHPYTTFYDKVNVMFGTLLFEKKDYSGALDYFNKVNEKHLGENDRIDYIFNKGYAYIQTGAYHQASAIFKSLRLNESNKKVAATYYYGYSEYMLKNYAVALPEFLLIQNDATYKEQTAYHLFQVYYYLNDTTELNQRAENLLKNYPDSPHNLEVYRIMGELAYVANDFNKTIEYLEKYDNMSTQPLRTDLYYLGIAHIKTNKFDAAIPYFQRVTTESDPLTENAYLHLGNAYLKTNEKENARLAFEAALRTNFDKNVREEALLNYALTTYETNAAFGASISAFEQFLNEFPNSKDADKIKSYLALEYMSTSNYELAYESIQKVAQPNAKILEAKQYLLYQLGTQSFAQNNFEKAINYFTLAIKNASAGSYLTESYYWRSESYYRLGMHDNSISDLKSFFNTPNAARSNNYVSAHYGMGYAYFSQKRFSQALNYFEQYTNIETKKNSDLFADALSRIGDCYFYSRDFRNAEMYYSRSVNLSPNTGDYALFQSAYVAGLQKKYTTKISRMNDLVDTYPNSTYADDALYEIGRSYLMLDNGNEALRSYRRLTNLFPNTSSARKAAVEIGMIYQNQDKLEEALTAYKTVVTNYSGSVEAYTALESIEHIYVEINDVPSYLTYAKSTDMKMPDISLNHEDSISYIAAEKQYMNANYAQAISGFRLYLKNYCVGGRYCINAQYFLADSYFRTKDFSNALTEFEVVTNMTGNQFTEESLMRSAEITYDQKNFESSLRYFEKLEKVAQSTERKNIARLGILRCSYYVNDYQRTINIVNEIVADPKSSAEVMAESKYNRAKAYIAISKPNLAIEDLKVLSQDLRTSNGAEAYYLLAKIHFEQGSDAIAEKEVLAFAQKNTAHQYWLARSFVLLSDIYIKQKKDFQAKQYLLSLQRNYKVNDDIQEMINSRLSAILQREKSKVNQ